MTGFLILFSLWYSLLGADIKDKLKCYDFDVHTMKTLKNIISPPWDFREFEVEKQTAEETGLAPLETSRKTPDPRPSLEETFEIEMNESDMMLETSMSDHSSWLQTSPFHFALGKVGVSSHPCPVFRISHFLTRIQTAPLHLGMGACQKRLDCTPLQQVFSDPTKQL